jgi:hypothetical protein
MKKLLFVAITVLLTTFVLAQNLTIAYYPTKTLTITVTNTSYYPYPPMLQMSTNCATTNWTTIQLNGGVGIIYLPSTLEHIS